MRLKTLFSVGIVSCFTLSGCVTPTVNETDVAQPAIISMVDAAQENFDVQPIVLTIDGRTPRKAGVAIPVDGSGPSDRDYEAGTVIATPALRPASWDFSAAPGQRTVGLIFAIPGGGFWNWAINTRGRGSEAVGVTLPLQAGCQYQIAVKLTTLGGKDFEPVVRFVRPIPANMGLPAATSCPRASDVPISLVKS